jgi:hypothetical protein
MNRASITRIQLCTNQLNTAREQVIAKMKTVAWRIPLNYVRFGYEALETKKRLRAITFVEQILA